ncbi:hypothetical protein [Spongiactinospora rosea]|uniref:hypothetical protein n=1 Tax=Spongiactinospora rosea TaxID=2248750 RepID=UPI0011C020E1|nr:hypothetical protein [Spongiactinospora rosea]
MAADLALARLQMGSPEAASDVLHQCIDVAGATRARVPTARIAEVRRRLQPWRSEGFVGDIDDHLREAMLAL